ncbi:hypothetical protein [Chlorogloeopsis sp. ULAP02]|uniref:hypothetical protein n=1 Tax=Chlorogloeopsis sp. ULAP02 TaxID=3107926 RepID=UPI003134DACB
MHQPTKEELLKAMKLMVGSRNWAGYLHFRRLLKLHYPSGFNGELRQMFCSLSDDDKLAYCNYFNDPPESMDKQQKKLKKKAKAAELKERQIGIYQPKLATSPRKQSN